TGSTTTFEALWMGVPVVTLAGDSMVSRWFASILTAIGLPDLVAPTPELYVRRVAGLARDPAALAGLCGGLGGRGGNSPICRGRHRARQMERIYRSVWHRWCSEQFR